MFHQFEIRKHTRLRSAALPALSLNWILRLFVVVALMALFATTLWLAFPVRAATITVNTTSDEVNNDDDCSLREAIIAANTDVAVSGCLAGNGADTVNIPAGTYAFTLSGADENGALTGDLDILEDLTIIGAGKSQTIIEANGLDRVFQTFTGTGTVVLSGLTLMGGNADDLEGGAIYAGSGTVTLTNVRVQNNVGVNGGGIAAYHSATVKIVNSRINDNTATGPVNGTGGGVNVYGTVHLIGSLVDGNTAAGSGGGIATYYGAGTLLVVNSTISGNKADFYGGGISNAGTTVLYNATIVENTADFDENDSGDGGGVYHASSGVGDFDFRNTVIGDNHDLSNAGSQVPD
jgi:CSLREA domain-containing protein